MSDGLEPQLDGLAQDNVFMKKYLSLRNKCEQLQQVAFYVDLWSMYQFSWVGSESPCRAELPSTDLHSLFFQIHPR